MRPANKKPKKQTQEGAHEPAFSVDNLVAPGRGSNWKIMVSIWAILLGLVAVGYYYHWEPHIVGGGVVLLAIFSNAFTWLIATAGLTPVIGPLLIKILALPIIWVLNAVGSVISYVAIRRGYSRDVLTYRGLTIALIVGVVIGYVIGKFV